ncbi:MAG TPA: hypothetical protein VGP46_12585, partial [Acidimicrobiales bacterium]|nr:hypothetical protein [Acidimicrobiales bacterium]
ARTGVNAVVLGPAMGRDAATVRRLCGDAACDVLSLYAGAQPQDGSVVVLVGAGSDDDAAVEVATRIWLAGTDPGGASPAPLCLVAESPGERGRARRLADRLQALAVADVSLDEPAGGAPLVVSGWPLEGGLPDRSRFGGGPRALVHSGEDPQRIGIDQRLLRLDLARRARQSLVTSDVGGGASGGDQ